MMRSKPSVNACQWVVAVLWTMACWLFFQYYYPYHFFFKEQNQLFLWSWEYVSAYPPSAGWMARLTGDFITQFYYYLYAGATLLTLTLLATGVLLRMLLVRLGAGRHVAFIVALVVTTAEAVFHLRYDFPLSATVSLTGWAALLLGATYVPRWRYAMLALSALVAYWLMGCPQLGKPGLPNWYAEHQLAVSSEYYFGNYDKVVSLVESEPEPTPEMKFFYYLVQARRDSLPDKLLRFSSPELGTFYHIGPETPLMTIRNMNELYWALGDITFTERAAMMALVFSPQNRNVHMVKRLAECQLVNGDSAAAEKFLRLLDQTVAYRRWARQARTNSFYTETKRATVNLLDTIAVSDNAHFLMMQLLDSNPSNTVALDYILCSNLLLKDITSYKRDYDRYCQDRPRLKRLYQEALCIWLAGTNAPEEQWHQLIHIPEVASRFRQYSQQRGSAAFRDTYWYYFDTAKAPQP